MTKLPCISFTVSHEDFVGEDITGEDMRGELEDWNPDEWEDELDEQRTLL
jgi:hypothetical protein